MDPISFKDVAQLVNRISGTQIDIDSPRQHQVDQFSVYGGSVSGSGFAFEFEILYLYSDATKDGVRAARNWLSRLANRENVRIVFAPSVRPSIIEELIQLGYKCLSLSEYFATFLRQQTETYISKIKSLSFADYIDPHISSRLNIKRKIPNPVLSFMKSSREFNSEGDIAVLLGEPGQGKTHMSKYMASELVKMGHIPIYIHSEQWEKMQVEDLSSIWKTILSSFRYFDAPIGWAEGVEKEFIRVALRLGIFRIIFDGFDEYILRNRGTIDARDTLRELISLADETGATLCITSRTSFYQSEILEDENGKNIESENKLFSFTICPFDANHAGNYFKKRFPKDESAVAIAAQLFERLMEDSSNDASNFVGRGFFLTLIADLVSRGYTPLSLGIDGQTRLQWIMDALCRREEIRQSLPIDARAQLNVMREFSDLVARGDNRSSETLRFVLEYTAGLNPQQIDQLIKSPAKFKDHPLIQFSTAQGNWHFTQDQIEYVLLAERVIELASLQGEKSQLVALLNSSKFFDSLHTEIATTIVQQTFELRSDFAALDVCKDLIQSISQAGGNLSVETRSGCHQFAGTLALLAAGHAHKKGADRKERTHALVKLLPAGELKNAQFIGTMIGLDLRDIIISKCYFDNVTFTNCRFSSSTRFVDCRFAELRVTNCEQFGRVQWDESNAFDLSSRRLIEAEMIASGQRQYAEENLQGDLDFLIRRFLVRETSGFKNIEERNLARGLIGHSIYKTQIINSFQKTCLEINPVNGKSVLSVAPDVRAEFLFYVGNGVMTGALAKVREDLRRKLLGAAK